MNENPSPKTERSTLQVFIGFLFGFLVALGCTLLAMFLGLLLRIKSDGPLVLLIALSLVAAGAIALRTLGKSSFAIGVLISLSLALLLDGTCGIVFR